MKKTLQVLSAVALAGALLSGSAGALMTAHGDGQPTTTTQAEKVGSWWKIGRP